MEEEVMSFNMKSIRDKINRQETELSDVNSMTKEEILGYVLSSFQKYMVENKLINIDWLISKIEYELSQSTTSIYKCTDGTVIKTDVGYVEEWWNEYKQHLIQQLTDNSKPMKSF